MNREEMQRMWEQMRDGELDAEQREMFDEHMVGDRESAAQWGAETRWLESLKQTPLPMPGRDEPTFTEKVLDRWEDQPRRGVLGRIDWRTARFAGGWTAAAAAIALLMVLTQPPGQPTLDNQLNVVHNVQPPTVDPLTVLVADVTDQMQQRPAEVYHIVRDTSTLLSVDQVIRMMNVDPAALDHSQVEIIETPRRGRNPIRRASGRIRSQR